MNLIVAVDKEYCIGKDNKLLTYLPKDLEFFKEKTIGNYLIMGRKTVESLKGGKALPNRTTIMLTKNEEYKKEGLITVHSIEDALYYIRKNKIPSKEIFVAGGAKIYEEFLPYCDTAYITKIEHTFHGDTFIEKIENSEEWKRTYKSEKKEYGEFTYYHTTYKRILPIE